MKKQWLVIMLVLSLMLVFSASVMAHGGGGGGGGGGDGGADGLETEDPDNAELINPPAMFSPIPLMGEDNEFVMGDVPYGSSADPTEATILNNEDLGEDFAAIMAELSKDPYVQWVVITAGGIVIGYATAGAGLPVYAQAIAGGIFAGGSAYATQKPGEESSAADSTVQNTVIGFIPVPPPAQAAISEGVTKARDLYSQSPGYQQSLRDRDRGVPGGFSLTYSQ